MPKRTKPTYREALLSRPTEPGGERLTVIRNVTLEPVFTDFLLYYNPHAAVTFCEPAAYLREPAVGEQAVCLLRLQELCPQLYDHVYEWSEAELKEELSHALRLYTELMAVWKERRTAVLLFLPEMDPGEYVPRGLPSFNRAVSRLQRELEALTEGCSSITLVSTDRVLGVEGLAHTWNRRGLYAFGAPYSPEGCRALAGAVADWQRAMRVPPRKCLVLDCDNVLWGGVAAEEGPEAVRLGTSFIGRAYRDFQREVLRLWTEGVLLCLCSKNEEATVFEMFDRHPDMLLRREHLTAYRINFHSKADNLIELAEELGLSLDSMVLADDSVYEIGLCRHRLPDVAVLHLPADQPEQFVPLLRECGLFDRLQVTEEDRRRGTLYREDARRKKAAACADEASYRAFLQTTVVIRSADDWDLPRIAALSARTHQCNLADNRLTEAELETIRRSEEAELLVLRASDVFGDMGLVAACWLSYDDDKVVIEGFWMSCRVFERGFEQQLLEACRQRAENRGCSLAGRFHDNGRNARFSALYQQQGIPLVEKALPLS